ncbi:GNAT family N-acetyltransferase [Alicyclobacillus sp. ALC3]|uniref:GNAT family N-acetyltransferase n=1 Tax=Alicyclobacillus sp. ALC3 TaxID=2796143 RepID=UPI002379C1B2|nr:GNAT family protein [Alicyclobacillus sp. ALC3]WDL95980.1 GNAT family N-acetyltransferase [Alicyclobacillus sp. ALC3]
MARIDGPLQALSGQWVKLVPLSVDHIDAIYEAGRHELIWDYMFDRIHTRDDAVAYVENALSNRDVGTELPLVNVELATGRVVGSTRLFDYSPVHRQVEIGHTWLTPSVWRSAINTESKLLLLKYCFEELKLLRVQLKTDGRNVRSQTAIARLGAKQEGVLRKHRLLPDGYIRDTVMFSILDDEWPSVRDRLQGLLSAH